MIFLDGSRGFRCAPTPGYHLSPLRGKGLHLFLKDHNRAEKINPYLLSPAAAGIQVQSNNLSGCDLEYENRRLNG
jgi:hypothetical protein